MTGQGVCDVALKFFKGFKKPQNSKNLTMGFPKWFIFSFPLGDFIFFFLLGGMMQVMMMADKSHNNRSKFLLF